MRLVFGFSLQVLLAGFGLLCFLGLLTPGPAAEPWDAPPSLWRIDIRGLDDENTRKAQEALALQSGDPLPFETLSQLQMRLSRYGLPPASIQIEPVRAPLRPKSGQGLPVNLIIDFAWPPRVEAVQFYPLIPMDALLFIAAGPLIKPGDWLDMAQVQKKAEAIERLAVHYGYEQVVVTPVQESFGASRVALGFIIESKSQPVTLKSLYFSGSGVWDIINRMQLEQVLRNLGNQEPNTRDESSTHSLVSVNKGTTITARTLLGISETGEIFYQQKGYLDVQVRLKKVETLPNGKQVRLRYSIIQGARYRVGEVAVQDVGPLPEAAFESIGRPYEGRYLTAKRYRALLEEMRVYCQKQGYMAPEIAMHIQTQPEIQKARLLPTIDPGTTSTLGEVRVVHRPLKNPPKNPDGVFQRFRSWMAPPVKDSVLRRQVAAQEGEDLNYWTVRIPERNYEQWRFLEDIKVETRPTSDTTVRDIVIDVTDMRSGTFDLTAGWSMSRGAMGSLFISEDNLGGRADSAALQLSASNLEAMGMFSYLDRNWEWGETFLGPQRVPSLSHNFYWTRGWYRHYSQTVKGVAWELRYRSLNRRSLWQDAWRLRFDKVELNPYEPRDHYEESFDDYIAATLAYQLFRDTRNRADFSTKGSYIGTSLEAGFADGPLLKSYSSAEAYWTFWRYFTWRPSGALGFMPWEAAQVGINERFHGGGAGDVRGFEVRGIGPVDKRESHLHTGGATKVLLSNELRINLNENLLPLVFYDLGCLDREAFSLTDWNSSAGAGFRFIMPGGATEAFFFYAKILNKEKTDNTDHIQFGIQFALN